jgi:hypothetical protein
MKPLSAPVSALVSAAFLALSAAPLRAVDLQTLVDRPPFSPPPQAADTGTAEPQGTLEFRGMVTDAEGTAYSVFDTTTNKGRWVRAEDTNSPVQVKGFDAANNTLEVEQNGRAVKLPLKRAIIQAGQPVAAMTPAAPLPNAAPGNPAANQARPEGAGDARRLEAVAAEVRRRRALRNSANGTRQGQPAPAATPAPAAPGAVPPPPAP